MFNQIVGKTEFTTTIEKSNSISTMAVRNAIDPEKYDEYRQLWNDASNLKIITGFPLQIDFELNYSCTLLVLCVLGMLNQLKIKEKQHGLILKYSKRLLTVLFLKDLNQLD